jgi:hypothetical protein
VVVAGALHVVGPPAVEAEEAVLDGLGGAQEDERVEGEVGSVVGPGLGGRCRFGGRRRCCGRGRRCARRRRQREG